MISLFFPRHCSCVELGNRHWRHFGEKSPSIEAPLPTLQLVPLQHLPWAPVLQWHCCLRSGEFKPLFFLPFQDLQPTVSEIGGSASSTIISAFDWRFRCLFVLVALASLHTHCWATFWPFSLFGPFFQTSVFFAVFYFLHHTAPVGNTNTLEVGAPVETLRIITLSLLVLSHGDTRSKARHQEFMSLWIYYAAGTRHSFNCMKN